MQASVVTYALLESMWLVAWRRVQGGLHADNAYRAEKLLVHRSRPSQSDCTWSCRQVRVSFADHTFKSRVVSSLDPEYGDVFEFLVDRDQAAQPDACITCEVRDIRGVDDVKVGACSTLSAGLVVHASSIMAHLESQRCNQYSKSVCFCKGGPLHVWPRCQRWSIHVQMMLKRAFLSLLMMSLTGSC